MLRRQARLKVFASKLFTVLLLVVLALVVKLVNLAPSVFSPGIPQSFPPLTPLFNSFDTKLVEPADVVLAQFGVLERASGCPRQWNEKTIVQSATLGFTKTFVRLGAFIDVQKVDGCVVPLHKKLRLRKEYNFTFLKVYSENALDDHISSYVCRDVSSPCARPFWREDYTDTSIKFALRTLFIENELSKMLSHPRFSQSVVVAYSSDILLSHPIHMHDIITASKLRSVFYGSQNNDGNGFTNGLYVGHTTAIQRVMATWNYLHIFSDSLQGTDYEHLLKLNCEMRGVQRRVLTGFTKGRRLNRKQRFRDFIKIRANGAIFGPLKCNVQSRVNLTDCPMLAGVHCEGNVHSTWAMFEDVQTSCEWYENTVAMKIDDVHLSSSPKVVT